MLDNKLLNQLKHDRYKNSNTALKVKVSSLDNEFKELIDKQPLKLRTKKNYSIGKIPVSKTNRTSADPLKHMVDYEMEVIRSNLINGSNNIN